MAFLEKLNNGCYMYGGGGLVVVDCSTNSTLYLHPSALLHCIFYSSIIMYKLKSLHNKFN